MRHGGRCRSEGVGRWVPCPRPRSSSGASGLACPSPPRATLLQDRSPYELSFTHPDRAPGSSAVLGRLRAPRSWIRTSPGPRSRVVLEHALFELSVNSLSVPRCLPARAHRGLIRVEASDWTPRPVFPGCGVTLVPEAPSRCAFAEDISRWPRFAAAGGISPMRSQKSAPSMVRRRFPATPIQLHTEAEVRLPRLAP